jgi:hypothetical protein
MYLAQVADGYGECISRIVRLRDFRQSKLEPDHLLDLLLTAGAVVGYHLLYLGWRVFKGWDAASGWWCWIISSSLLYR